MGVWVGVAAWTGEFSQSQCEVINFDLIIITADEVETIIVYSRWPIIRLGLRCYHFIILFKMSIFDFAAVRVLHVLTRCMYVNGLFLYVVFAMYCACNFSVC